MSLPSLSVLIASSLLAAPASGAAPTTPSEFSDSLQAPVALENVRPVVELSDSIRLEVGYDLQEVGRVSIAVHTDDDGSGVGFVAVDEAIVAELRFAEGSAAWETAVLSPVRIRVNPPTEFAGEMRERVGGPPACRSARRGQGCAPFGRRPTAALDPSCALRPVAPMASPRNQVFRLLNTCNPDASLMGNGRGYPGRIQALTAISSRERASRRRIHADPDRRQQADFSGLGPAQAHVLAASIVQVWHDDAVIEALSLATADDRDLKCTIAGQLAGAVSGVGAFAACEIFVPNPVTCGKAGGTVGGWVAVHITNKCNGAQNH